MNLFETALKNSSIKRGELVLRGLEIFDTL